MVDRNHRILDSRRRCGSIPHFAASAACTIDEKGIHRTSTKSLFGPQRTINLWGFSSELFQKEIRSTSDTSGHSLSINGILQQTPSEFGCICWSVFFEASIRLFSNSRRALGEIKSVELIRFPSRNCLGRLQTLTRRKIRLRLRKGSSDP